MHSTNSNELLNNILNVIDKLGIAIIIAVLSYFFTKRQSSNTTILQYRQKWIDDIRDGISLFISEAELISMVELEDDEVYFEHFKEFSREQHKVILLLDEDNEYHNGIIEVMDEIRDLIHARDINEEKLTKSIEDLLDTAKVAIQMEFKMIKKN